MPTRAATRELTGTTPLIALLADPVDHVRAQLAFNAMFAEEGVDAAVVPLNVTAAGLPSAFDVLRAASNVAGLLLTIPHKVAAAELCDRLGPNAELVGAVNAVRFDGAASIGEIFDGIGLVAAAAANGIEIAGRRVLVIGTGGAGTAVATAVAEAGPAQLSLSNRTTAKAEALADRLASRCPVAVTDAGPGGHDVVINCTSLGLDPGDPHPADIGTIEPGAAVIDIIANPAVTPFRQAAIDAGLVTMGGGPMIEHQLAAIARHLLPDRAG